MSAAERDLVVVAADKDIEQILEGVLRRPAALGIRPVDYKLLVHEKRDPGCYLTSQELLQPYAKGWAHGLVVFDRAWDGAPSSDPAILSANVDAKLASLWQDRARCIVIEPEVESWVFGDSPHVADALGWAGRIPPLRDWLQAKGLWPEDRAKPPDPALAFRKATYAAKVKPSAAVFRKIADKVSLERCTDPSFGRLRTTLRGWFPPAASPRQAADEHGGLATKHD